MAIKLPDFITGGERTGPFGLVAEFDKPNELLHAAEQVRDAGYKKFDCLSPFPIHGMDDAMGTGQSKLGYLVLPFGILGAVTALLLQWWTGAVDYPLRIGGKPYFAFEPSIPVTFELTVLLSAFATVLGMFALNGLPQFYHPVMNYKRFNRVTDDKFLLVIEAADPKFDTDRTTRLLQSLGAKHSELVEA